MSEAFLIVDLQEQYKQSATVVRKIESVLPEVRKRMPLVWIFMGQSLAFNMPVPASNENFASLIKLLRPDANMPLLRPDASDLLMTKQLCDSFEKTGLGSFLKSEGIENTSLAGFTDMTCVPLTGEGALKAGFNPRIVRDMTGGVPERGACPDALKKYHRKGLETISSQELLLAPT